MANYPVKWFMSGQRDAPVLTSAAGALLSVLDACLIDGFGAVSVTGISVTDGVATATVGAGESFAVDVVVKITGATPAGLNGEQRVLTTSSTTFTFATSAANGAATGTISARQAPVSGWEKAYTGSDKTAYRSIDPQANGHLLRVDDGNSLYALAAGYEAMSDVDTGTGRFPASGDAYWFKQNTDTGANAIGWFLVGDSRFFLFGIDVYRSNTAKNAWGFGDARQLVPGDAWATLVSGSYSTYTSGTPPVGLNLVRGDNLSNWIARKADGTVGAVNTMPRTYVDGGTNEFRSGYSGPLGATPPDGKLRLARVFMPDANGLTGSPRLEVPGLLWIAHTNGRSVFINGQIYAGSGGLSGRKLLAIDGRHTGGGGAAENNYLIDITGPWR